MLNKISAKRKACIGLMRALMAVAAVLTCALVLFFDSVCAVKGLPNISWELLSTRPSYLSGTIGILPDIMNTLYVVITTIAIVLPLGVGAAILPDRVREQQKDSRRHRVRGGDPLRHTLDHIRPCRHAIFLRLSGDEDLASGGKSHARHHEPAHHHANHAGEP